MAVDCRDIREFYNLQPELLNEASLRQILELVSIVSMLWLRKIRPNNQEYGKINVN